MRLRRSTRQVGEDEAIPASLPAFFGNATVGGGPALVRAYIEELLPDVLEGRIEPGRVLARTVGLDGVPDGYRAMDDRESIKVMVSMRDKERLLSPDEPLRFIFSHSALREGWDNPNVFQICTLNEARSEVKKRQEIGRGLRILVDETGERVFDASYNRLTIVANESYAEFARALQTEIRDEIGVDFSGRTKNVRDRRTASLKGGWKLDADFRELWERIKHRTRYRVEYDTDELIRKAAESIKDSMAPIEAPKIVIRKGALSFGDFEEKGLTTSMLSADEVDVLGESVRIPDILGHIQRETELTRSTIARILVKSGRLPDVTKNPQQFLDRATKEIRKALDGMMIDGIKYERVAGQEYEMRLFADKEITSYVEKMVDTEKSIYDSFPLDSMPEQNFVRDLNTREDIRFFLKLPNWFKIEPPIGTRWRSSCRSGAVGGMSWW
ncbi:MAG TPA: hypothetical protein VN178_00105, partial [Rubrobacter sp.]|nr:hypothetical protein [Rubrobacter sp.]